MTIRLFVVLALMILSLGARADWLLNNHRSELTFVSTKAIDIAEVHRFDSLAGRIEDNGKAVVTIDLASVDTGIDIRDERMRTMLFDVENYPQATIRTRIDKNAIRNMFPGGISRRELEFEMDFQGIDLTFTAAVVITRLSETALMVVSSKPVIINAASVNLTAGIESLRSVANLPSIGAAVPVSFALVFEK